MSAGGRVSACVAGRRAGSAQAPAPIAVLRAGQREATATPTRQGGARDRRRGRRSRPARAGHAHPHADWRSGRQGQPVQGVRGERGRLRPSAIRGRLPGRLQAGPARPRRAGDRAVAQRRVQIRDGRAGAGDGRGAARPRSAGHGEPGTEGGRLPRRAVGQPRRRPSCMPIAPGCYALNMSFRISAGQDRCFCPYISSAEFAPPPALPPSWIREPDPFGGMDRSALGFQVVLRVEPMPAAEAEKQPPPQAKAPAPAKNAQPAIRE